jgi:hypothetical protein
VVRSKALYPFRCLPLNAALTIHRFRRFHYSLPCALCRSPCTPSTGDEGEKVHPCHKCQNLLKYGRTRLERHGRARRGAPKACPRLDFQHNRPYFSWVAHAATAIIAACTAQLLRKRKRPFFVYICSLYILQSPVLYIFASTEIPVIIEHRLIHNKKISRIRYRLRCQARKLVPARRHGPRQRYKDD